MKYKHLLKYLLSLPEEGLEDDITVRVGSEFIPIWAVAQHDGDELDEGHVVLLAAKENL